MTVYQRFVAECAARTRDLLLDDQTPVSQKVATVAVDFNGIQTLIQHLENAIGEAADAAMPFQPGGALREEALAHPEYFKLGESTVVSGMKWLLAERERLTTKLTDAGRRIERLEARMDPQDIADVLALLEEKDRK